MTRKAIIYTRLIERLNHFTSNGSVAESYHDHLTTDEQKNSFMVLMEQIEQSVSLLEEENTGDILPSDLPVLLSNVESLMTEFGDFPDARFHELLSIICITDKIKSEVAGEENFDIAQDVNTDAFTLYELERPIYHKNFFYHDSGTLENSVFMISIQSIRDLKKFIIDKSIPVELLFQMLAKVGTDQVLDASKEYLLIKSGLPDKTMEACIRLHLVKAGHYFHFPQPYESALNIHADRKILPDRSYNQFLDTLLIISEYNYQRDILDKYLRLYHVIENFMFRLPLVKLERSNGGRPFSIRDFQRLYREVSTNELGALKKLVKKVFQENYNTTPTNFGDFVMEKWAALCPGIVSVADVNTLLKYLTVTNGSGDIVEHANINSIEVLTGAFAQMIYSYRNAIVHNKDTELHLSHETLLSHAVMRDTAHKVMEEFLIPCMEEITFYLVIEDNNIVRFEHSTLKLWEDVA